MRTGRILQCCATCRYGTLVRISEGRIRYDCEDKFCEAYQNWQPANLFSIESDFIDIEEMTL